MANGVEETLSGRFAAAMTSPIDPTVVNVSGVAPQLVAQGSPPATLVEEDPTAAGPAQQQGLPPLLPGRGLLANILAGALLGAASGAATRQRGAGAVLSGLGGGFATNFGARQQIQQRQQAQSNIEAAQQLEEKKFAAAADERFLKNLKIIGEINLDFAELGDMGRKGAQSLLTSLGNKVRPVTQQEMDQNRRLGKTVADLMLPVGEDGSPVAFAFTNAKAPATGVLEAKIGKETVRVAGKGFTNEQQFDVFMEAARQAGQKARAGDKEANIAAINFVSGTIIQAAGNKFGRPVTDTAINAIMQEQQAIPNSPVNRFLADTNIKFSELDAEVKARARTIGAARQEQAATPFELRDPNQPARVQLPSPGGEPQLGTTLQGTAVPEVLVLRTVQGQRPDDATLRRLKGKDGDINLQDGTITLPPFLPPEVRRQIQEVLGEEGILMVPQPQ